MLLAVSGSESSINALFESMKNDEVSNLVRRDHLIKLFALREFSKNGHDKDRHQFIRNQIRQLGRLLLKLRETKDGDLEYFMKPECFHSIFNATKEQSGCNEKGMKFVSFS